MTNNITFSPYLDIISENIIYLLSLDSRQSTSDLAKTLNVNRKIVENRVKKLFNEGYVKYLTISNEKKRTRFTMLVKVKEIDDAVFEKIKQIPCLIKLKNTFGNYDLSALFDAYSPEEMERTIANVSNLLHAKLVALDVIPHDFEDTMGYKSFCHNIAFFQRYKMLKPQQISLSEDEEMVLGIIKKETNFTMKVLSQKTKMGFPKLKSILTKLDENQLVRYSLDPVYQKLGLEFHNMFVKIKIGKREHFEKYLIAYPRVHWVKHCTTGKWDYVLSITAKNLDELAEITKEIRTANKDLILDETTLISHIREMRRR